MTIHPTAHIHKSAMIEEGARIGAHCQIGAFSYIGANVQLDENVQCFSHVAIDGHTKIGEGTRIWPHAAIGYQPQDLKYAGEETYLEIGKRNMIRESTSLHPGTEQGGSWTRIGDDNLFMLGAHIGHDCVIGNSCVFANNVAVAGHVQIADEVIIGGQSGIVQFSRIGRGAMIGAGVIVASDVIPYGLVTGERAELSGLNWVGLQRRGLDRGGLREMKSAFHHLTQGEGNFRDKALQLVELSQSGEHEAYLQEIAQFVSAQTDRSFLSQKAKRS